MMRWTTASSLISSNQNLTTLGLSYNQIGENGVKCIIEALQKNQILTILDLEDNDIRETDFITISKTLKENMKIKYHKDHFKKDFNSIKKFRDVNLIFK